MGIFRNWSRRRILAKPFPESWRAILQKNVAWYHILSDDERTKLERDTQLFIAEKYWEGCAGQKITDEVRVTVAGQACLLILKWDDYLFERVRTILVYPGAYRERRDRDLIEEGDPGPQFVTLGEAHYRAPVVLSWADSKRDAGRIRYGHNVILHEFAHVLDMEDSMIDGIPVEDEHVAEQWAKVMARDFEQLRNRLESRRPTVLNDYAAKNEGEFFAVATEAFFTNSVAFREHHSELYELFADYFRQDPAQRFESLGQSAVKV